MRPGEVKRANVWSLNGVSLWSSRGRKWEQGGGQKKVNRKKSQAREEKGHTGTDGICMISSPVTGPREEGGKSGVELVETKKNKGIREQTSSKS